ncbi:MAG: glycosyltransferase [Tissierellia bacterium]|nr:glycosyltransferase [Tissierellia bacterium]
MKRKIFIPIPYFLPGENGGGPVRSIINLIDHSCNYFDYYVITKNTDFNSSIQYDLPCNTWIQMSNYKVCYLIANRFNLSSIVNQYNSIQPNVIYLNSFFSSMSIKLVLFSIFNKEFLNKLVISPRGEFSKGALSQKKFKKQFFLRIAQITGMYRSVPFIASTTLECEDIKSIFKNNTVHIAMNLPAINKFPIKANVQNKKEVGSAKILFISRINRMKNLDYALVVLKGVLGNVSFDVYGPIEDNDYYQDCLQLAKGLPENITFSYKGVLKNDLVIQKIAEYDALLLPTKGENYGHVIVEALTACVPVIISDNTPWNNLEHFNAGYNIDLSDLTKFREKIEKIVSMNSDEMLMMKRGVKDYLSNNLDINENTKDNINIFLNLSVND